MYYIIFITACIFDFLLNNIKNHKLYFYGYNRIPYTRYELVCNLETLLYKITTIGDRIPYLIYCPYKTYKVDYLREELLLASSIREKILVLFELVLAFLQCFIGIRIVYFVLLLVWLYEKFHNQFNRMIILLFKIDYLHYIHSFYQYIITNGSAFLLIVIFVLSFYIYSMKRKSLIYKFEDIWVQKENEQIKDIANKQLEICTLLHEILHYVYDNCVMCSKCIRQIDNKMRYRTYNNATDSYSLLYNFIDFENQLTDIKNKIKYIQENNGSLYKQYNKNMWFQLNLLDLTNSEMGPRGLYYCNKRSLEFVLEDLQFKDIKQTRKNMLYCWSTCISMINGILRYLNYVNKRRRKHDKLHLNLNNFESIKEIVEEMRE